MMSCINRPMTRVLLLVAICGQGTCTNMDLGRMNLGSLPGDMIGGPLARARRLRKTIKGIFNLTGARWPKREGYNVRVLSTYTDTYPTLPNEGIGLPIIRVRGDKVTVCDREGKHHKISKHHIEVTGPTPALTADIIVSPAQVKNIPAPVHPAKKNAPERARTNVPEKAKVGNNAAEKPPVRKGRNYHKQTPGGPAKGNSTITLGMAVKMRGLVEPHLEYNGLTGIVIQKGDPGRDVWYVQLDGTWALCEILEGNLVATTPGYKRGASFDSEESDPHGNAEPDDAQVESTTGMAARNVIATNSKNPVTHISSKRHPSKSICKSKQQKQRSVEKRVETHDESTPGLQRSASFREAFEDSDPLGRESCGSAKFASPPAQVKSAGNAMPEEVTTSGAGTPAGPKEFVTHGATNSKSHVTHTPKGGVSTGTNTGKNISTKKHPSETRSPAQVKSARMPEGVTTPGSETPAGPNDKTEMRKPTKDEKRLSVKSQQSARVSKTPGNTAGKDSPSFDSSGNDSISSVAERMKQQTQTMHNTKSGSLCKPKSKAEKAALTPKSETPPGNVMNDIRRQRNVQKGMLNDKEISSRKNETRTKFDEPRLIVIKKSHLEKDNFEKGGIARFKDPKSHFAAPLDLEPTENASGLEIVDVQDNMVTIRAKLDGIKIVVPQKEMEPLVKPEDKECICCYETFTKGEFVLQMPHPERGQVTNGAGYTPKHGPKLNKGDTVDVMTQVIRDENGEVDARFYEKIPVVIRTTDPHDKDKSYKSKVSKGDWNKCFKLLPPSDAKLVCLDCYKKIRTEPHCNPECGKCPCGCNKNLYLGLSEKFKGEIEIIDPTYFSDTRIANRNQQGK